MHHPRSHQPSHINLQSLTPTSSRNPLTTHSHTLTHNHLSTARNNSITPYKPTPHHLLHPLPSYTSTPTNDKPTPPPVCISARPPKPPLFPSPSFPFRSPDLSRPKDSVDLRTLPFPTLCYIRMCMCMCMCMMHISCILHARTQVGR